MSNVTVSVLTPQQQEAFSDPFSLNGFPAMTVNCAGLQSAETGTVQVQNPIDMSWDNYYQGNVLIQFTSEIVSQDVWATAATYRIHKSATTALVGVSVTKYISGGC